MLERQLLVLAFLKLQGRLVYIEDTISASTKSQKKIAACRVRNGWVKLRIKVEGNGRVAQALNLGAKGQSWVGLLRRNSWYNFRVLKQLVRIDSAERSIDRFRRIVLLRYLVLWPRGMCQPRSYYNSYLDKLVTHSLS